VTEVATYGNVLLDTGPLVAILNQRDQYHHACTSALRSIRPPLRTCWPVLTEAAWLLRDHSQAIQKLFRAPSIGLFEILPLGQEDLLDMGRLFRKYESLHIQLADIALVHLATRENADTVFTLDRRDFSTFRVHGNKGFRLLPESLE